MIASIPWLVFLFCANITNIGPMTSLAVQNISPYSMLQRLTWRTFPCVIFSLIHNMRMSNLKPETTHPTRLATGWKVLGSNTGGGRDIPHLSRPALGPTQSPSCTIGTGSFSGIQSGRGVTLTPHPLVMPWSRKSRAIPLLPLWTVRPVQSLSACTTVHFTFTYTSTPPMDRTACTQPQCLYNGALYLYLYLYSPYGPYSLYRASVPVQRCTLPSSTDDGVTVTPKHVGAVLM